MTTTRFISLALLAALPLGCHRSSSQQQKVAVAAQDQAKQAAADERGKVADVAASASLAATKQADATRDETDKKIEAANQQVGERLNPGVSADDAKVIDTQIAADRQAMQAADAFQKARLELEGDIDKQLDSIDKRTADVRRKLSNDRTAVPNAADLRQVETQSKALRSDLQAFESKTARSIQSFQVKLEQSLLKLRKAVDNLEGKPPLPEPPH